MLTKIFTQINKSVYTDVRCNTSIYIVLLICRHHASETAKYDKR